MKDLLPLYSYCQTRDSDLGEVQIMRVNAKAESE